MSKEGIPTAATACWQWHRDRDSPETYNIPAMEPEQTVRNPRLSNLQEPFVSNPFRVLRLPAGASGSEIRQTTERVQIEARLGSSREVETRLAALTKAQAELLDPSKRTQHEILWFYDPPNCVFQNELEDTNRALERYRAGGDTENDWRIAHDLALWLVVEAVHSKDSESRAHWGAG